MKNTNHKYQSNNGIYLEPRLQAFIEKKKYYRKNNIVPSIAPEIEFQITHSDAQRLKNWMNGDKDIYNHNTQEQYQNLDISQDLERNPDSAAPKFDFDPEAAYKADERYTRFAKKMERNEAAQSQRYNRDSLGQDFENAWKPLTNLHISDPEIGCNTHNFRNQYDERNFIIGKNSSQDTKSYPNKYKTTVNPQISQQNKYYDLYEEDRQVAPKLDYKNRTRMQETNMYHNPDIENILGKLDTYERKIQRSYQHKSEMDTETKINIPSLSSNGKKNLNTSSYHSMPFMGRGEGIRDINSEILMQNGSHTRTSKSFGYFNPVEHYYDYISDDMQRPEHSVFERGSSTRLDNHKFDGATNSRDRVSYIRDIY